MIVGIGELLWDLFPDGRKVAGGAPFNFAFHCQQLGHPAAIVSRVGDDELGRELRAEVKRLGLTDEWIQTDRDHPTGTVRVTVDAGGQPAYEIVEGVAWDYIGEEGPIDEGLAHDTEAVCFGTLAQRHAVSRSTIQDFVGPGAHMPSALRVLDVNLREPDDTYELAERVWKSIELTHWLKLTDAELSRVYFFRAMDDDREFGRKESPIRRIFDLGPEDTRRVGILTRGEKSTAVTDWQRTEWFPTVPIDVVDTVGAGDSFTAAMVCLHLEGRPLRECARFATRYAARVCEFQGGTPRIDRREIEASVL